MSTYADPRQQKMETGKKIKRVLKDHRNNYNSNNSNNSNNSRNREECDGVWNLKKSDIVVPNTNETHELPTANEQETNRNNKR